MMEKKSIIKVDTWCDPESRRSRHTSYLQLALKTDARLWGPSRRNARSGAWLSPSSLSQHEVGVIIRSCRCSSSVTTGLCLIIFSLAPEILFLRKKMRLIFLRKKIQKTMKNIYFLRKKIRFPYLFFRDDLLFGEKNRKKNRKYKTIHYGRVR